MAGSASPVSENNDTPPIISTHSKLKTYGFAIALILGIGALTAGACGVVGFFRVGALSQMSQIDAIVTMAVGGGSGIVLLMIGVVGHNLKNAPSTHTLPLEERKPPRMEPTPTPTPGQSSAPAATPTPPQKVVDTPLKDSPFVFGTARLNTLFGITILDNVPEVPNPSLANANAGKRWMYLPKKIKYNGKDLGVSLATLKEIVGEDLKLHESIDPKIVNETTEGGWILIHEEITLKGKNLEMQQREIGPEHRTSKVIETVWFAFIILKAKIAHSWGTDYVRCIDHIISSSNCMHVRFESHSPRSVRIEVLPVDAAYDDTGVLEVQSFKNPP